MQWDDNLLELYQRQILLKDIGIEGQERICNAKILVIGAGAIGSSALYYLASSGVGNIGILGDANVELADVAAQILYTQKDVGKSKLKVAKSRLKAINPHTNIALHKGEFSPQNIAEIVRNYDIVLDCADSFAPKFAINAACVREGKVLIHGGIVDFSVQLMSIRPHISACYSCVYGLPKGFSLDFGDKCESNQNSNTPTCAKSAMLGALGGILGSMQATQAIKILCDIKESLFGSLITLHTREMQLKTEKFEKNKNCPICGRV